MKFEDKWIGRKFRCIVTGEVVELTKENVHRRAFIPVGDGAIDLGDGFYSRRVGKIEEVEREAL